jgi:hypothetical protein
MMMKSTRAAAVTSKLLSQALAFKFCYNWAPLDPRKHTTMNHNPHNMYLDLYEYGEYPDWYHLCSTAPKTYQPQVLNILVATLNARYVTHPSLRAPTSMRSFSSPNASASGIGSSPRTSARRKSSMKSTPHSSASSPQASSSGKAGSRGSSNKS